MEIKDIDKIYNKLLETKTMLVITGPTASGKTSLSLRLSEYLPLEIISADSRQLYKYMDIGTAKPTKEELQTVKHHFIDYLNPDEDYNAGKFGDEAEKVAEEIFKRAKIPVVVGGSGLYVKSLCEGLFKQDDNFAMKGIRTFLADKLKEKGRDYLYEELKKVDAQAAALYQDRNPRRILRALEYYYTYGQSITDSRKRNSIKRHFNFKYFGINFERKEIYKRINERVIRMWEDGLVSETAKLLNMGYSQDLNSLNTVGYKETIAYLNKKMNKNEAIAEIQKNTRRYAKRQMTWFKKLNNIYWFDVYLFERGEIPGIAILENI